VLGQRAGRGRRVGGVCERRRAVPGRAVPRAHDRRVGRWRGHVRNGKKLGGKYPKIDMVWQGNAVTFRLVPERRVAVAGKIIGRASMVFQKWDAWRASHFWDEWDGYI
jgi:hypothetical protein